MTQSQPILQLASLSKRYGDFRAVDAFQALQFAIQLGPIPPGAIACHAVYNLAMVSLSGLVGAC
jgi:hypothetical protein